VLTFYHAYQLGTPEHGCILLAGLLGDFRDAQTSVFGAFTDLETASNPLRIDGFLDEDFRRWR